MTDKNQNNQSSGLPEGQTVTMGETMDMPMPSLGGFDPPSERYIKSIFNEWYSKKEQALADLQVYLGNPVGVGEHANIAEEIKNKLKEIDQYDSLIETVKSNFMAPNTDPQSAP
jgi:hypothetical protein